MKIGTTMRRTAAGAGWVTAAALAVFSLPFAARMLLLLATAGLAWIWAAGVKQVLEGVWRDRLIRVLGHHRHDWMNELQVLYGYARLKRFDNLPEYMDKIRTTSLHDSFLSKLGIPELSVYLIEKRMAGGSCMIEIELEQELDLTRLQLKGHDVYRLIHGVTEVFLRSNAAAPDAPPMLSIGFDREEDELLVDFVYQGEADWSGLERELQAVLAKFRGLLEVREEEFGDGRAVTALAIPFRT